MERKVRSSVVMLDVRAPRLGNQTDARSLASQRRHLRRVRSGSVKNNSPSAHFSTGTKLAGRQICSANNYVELYANVGPQAPRANYSDEGSVIIGAEVEPPSQSDPNLVGGSRSKLNSCYHGSKLKNGLNLCRESRKHNAISTLSLLALLAVCAQNAKPSSGFGYTQQPHDHRLSDYYYIEEPNAPLTPLQPYQSAYLTQYNTNFWHPLYKRFADDVAATSPADRFTMDQSDTRAPFSSWTSMLGSDNQDTLDTHIRNILVPRVSGTPGAAQVRDYIVGALKANQYHVELDEFTDSTPVGKVKFSNIIASSNPNACRQLVLACHYDSKMMDGFLGATDSAVPCAMLLKMSEKFGRSFREDNRAKDDLGLRFVFFDGEEAFVEWTKSDSLYGSRHLAARWERQPPPQHCASFGVKSELGRIELLVLLDLIGTSDTSFVMYNRRLKSHYDNLRQYERNALAKSGLSARRESSFKSRHIPLNMVEDDHVPFMQRGVPILSLLAHPFPRVWHTTADNYEAIDFQKTRRILGVLEEFVANYSKVDG